MQMTHWADGLEPEDFPAAFAPFLDVLGVQLTAILAERLGGMQYYLPKIDKVRSVALKRMIINERATGKEYRAIARAHHVTETFVRQVCDTPAREAAQSRRTRVTNKPSETVGR